MEPNLAYERCGQVGYWPYGDWNDMPCDNKFNALCGITEPIQVTEDVTTYTTEYVETEVTEYVEYSEETYTTECH